MAIQSYISLGRRKSAIDLYKQLEKILKTELNLEPSPKIKNLITNL
jgi:DNA-binding SARP family transcriptional activator